MKREERRAYFRMNLSSLYLPFYEALCTILPEEWQPYSGFRSMAEQDALYAKGRTIAPIGIQNRVTSAKGGFSAHNYGAATDWAYFEGEKLLWLPKEDSRWFTYLAAVRKVGLKAGADFGDIDHNELALTCDWPHVKIFFDQGGMTAAQNHMKGDLLHAKPLC